MAALSRNAQVLRFLIEAAPAVGRIKLAKFAYLADCEAYRHLGRPISEFRYRFDNHGPFDTAFYGARDELLQGGYATESPEQIGPYTQITYRPTRAPVEYAFTRDEAEILRYVADTYMNLDARSLCDEVVYQTPPMKGAKVGERLRMDKMMKKGKPDPLGFNLERMLAGEASVEAGRFRPLDKALDELRTRHRA